MLFFTSDQHHAHKNIVRLSGRPYADHDAMTRDLIARHNARVASGDTVYHLGDFCFDARKIRALLGALNGTHRLVSGNHDETHPCHGKSESWARKYLGYGFASVDTQVDLEIGGVRFRLCHLPATGDSHDEARYPEHRPSLEGADLLLHGHVHGAWVRDGQQINVGVDVRRFAPATLSELLAA